MRPNGSNLRSVPKFGETELKMREQDPKLLAVLRPAVTALGYELLGMELAASQVLRLYVDSEAGVDVEDCARITDQVSALLEAEALLPADFSLEVSSPGLDRLLFTLEQMAKWVGHDVRLRLRVKWRDRRRLQGKLLSVEGEVVTIEAEGSAWPVPESMIERMRLVPDWGNVLRKRNTRRKPKAPRNMTRSENEQRRADECGDRLQ